MNRAFVAPLVGLFVILGAMLLEGGQLSSITQVTSLMIVAGGTVAALLAAFPYRVVAKSIRIAMRRGQTPLTEDLKQATEVFKTLGNAAVLSGIVGFLIGAIHVMENLKHPETGLIGPGIAVSIVPLLYGAIVKLLVATPLRDAIVARISLRR